MKKTTIMVSEEVWDELNRRRRLGESFDDVLKGLLKMGKTHDEKKA